MPAAVITWLAPEIAGQVLDGEVPVTLLIILAVYGVIRSAALALGTAANGIGAARRTVEASLLNVVGMAIAIPIAYSLAGISGVAAAVTIAIALSSGYMLVGLDRRVGLPGSRWGLLAATALGAWLVAALVASGSPLIVRASLLGATWLVATLIVVRVVGPGTRLASIRGR
jgi:O-antigen/teichoic acid export membrane protein